MGDLTDFVLAVFQGIAEAVFCLCLAFILCSGVVLLKGL